MIGNKSRSIEKQAEPAAVEFKRPLIRAYRSTLLALIAFLEGMVAAVASLLITAFSKRILEFAKLESTLQRVVSHVIDYASVIVVVIFVSISILRALRLLIPTSERVSSEKLGSMASWIAAQQRAERTIISLPKGVDLSAIELGSDNPDLVVEVLDAAKEIEG